MSVALANAFCAGARFLLWRMHPAIPGLAHWALAGGFGMGAFVLILLDKAIPWLPSLSLAQAFVVAGLVLSWDGFRRFRSRPPLSNPALAVLAAIALSLILGEQVEYSLAVRALINAAFISVLSGLIARELLEGPGPVPLAMRLTGWAYAANAAFFLIRMLAAVQAPEAVVPLDPHGTAPFVLLWWLGMVIAVTLGMVLMTAERLQNDLDNQANRDSLTGALNRRAFGLIAAKEVTRARRHGKPLSVLMIDLDKFKQVNDRLGHYGGDTMLCRFVATAQRILRGDDVLCRFGGEEFVALLPDTSAEQARLAAERLRIAFSAESATVVVADAPQPFPVTVSIGIGELAPGEKIESLLRRADAALYYAKERGRNRCEHADACQEQVHEPPMLRQAQNEGR